MLMSVHRPGENGVLALCVVCGDVAVWVGELDEPDTEGQLRVRGLDPELVWLAHEHEPWRPHTV